MITVRYYGPLRHITGVKEEQMSASQAAELLRQVEIRYGAEARCTAERSFIILNGQNIALIDGFQTSFQDGAIVQIIPLAGGG